MNFQRLVPIWLAPFWGLVSTQKSVEPSLVAFGVREWMGVITQSLSMLPVTFASTVATSQMSPLRSVPSSRSTGKSRRGMAVGSNPNASLRSPLQ